MFKEIKEMLINQVDVLCSLLESFGFEHINYKSREIRFARDEEGGLNIAIRLENNEALLVKDFARNICKDIFSYIVIEKKKTLREVLQKAKQLLKLDDDWAPRQTMELFGGIYNAIKTKKTEKLTTYPEEILKNYDMTPNRRFLRDGISLETQKLYNVGYDIESDRIIFPWRNEFGEIIAIKGRINIDEIPDEVPKYLYLVRNNVSQSLYNYYECYSHLYGERVYVFESEKSCQICYTRGIKNTVALGNHSLSREQAKLLVQLNPTEVVFMLDKDLPVEETMANISVLQEYSAYTDIKIAYWDWTKNKTLPSKAAPCDGTMEEWSKIVEKEIVAI